MEIELDLSKHCIETEIKRRYNSAFSAYFRTGEGPGRIESEGIIDLTQRCLQFLDFNRLRSTYPPLAGHSSAKVKLARAGDRLSLSIDGRPVELFLKR